MTAEVFDFVAELRAEGRDLIIVTQKMGLAREVLNNACLLQTAMRWRKGGQQSG